MRLLAQADPEDRWLDKSTIILHETFVSETTEKLLWSMLCSFFLHNRFLTHLPHLLQNNQVVGVGSGSTIVFAVDRLGKLDKPVDKTEILWLKYEREMQLRLRFCSKFLTNGLVVWLSSVAAERVRQEKLNIVCVPTSFQVSSSTENWEEVAVCY